MRSIGKVNIKKLNKIIEEEFEKENTIFINHPHIEKNIRNRIPNEWYDIWEMAYQEIERTIDDKLNELVYTG